MTRCRPASAQVDALAVRLPFPGRPSFRRPAVTPPVNSGDDVTQRQLRVRILRPGHVIKHAQKLGRGPAHGYLAVRLAYVRVAHGIPRWRALLGSRRRQLRAAPGFRDRPGGVCVTELRGCLNAHTLAAGGLAAGRATVAGLGGRSPSARSADRKRVRAPDDVGHEHHRPLVTPRLAPVTSRNTGRFRDRLESAAASRNPAARVCRSSLRSRPAEPRGCWASRLRPPIYAVLDARGPYYRRT